MVNNLISLVAAIFLGASKPANSFPMLVIGRALIGIFAGDRLFCSVSVSSQYRKVMAFIFTQLCVIQRVFDGNRILL